MNNDLITKVKAHADKNIETKDLQWLELPLDSNNQKFYMLVPAKIELSPYNYSWGEKIKKIIRIIDNNDICLGPDNINENVTESQKKQGTIIYA